MNTHIHKLTSLNWRYN